METTNAVCADIVGVPEELVPSAELFLAGRAEEVSNQEAVWLCQHARKFSARLLAALAEHPHGRPRATAASLCQDPDVLESLAADELNVSCHVIGNPAASSELVAHVLERWRAHPLNRGADWSAYVLSRAVWHPGLAEWVLDTLPARTVAHYNKERLATETDPDGTAELVEAFARSDPGLTLGEARERACFVAALRA